MKGWTLNFEGQDIDLLDSVRVLKSNSETVTQEIDEIQTLSAKVNKRCSERLAKTARVRRNLYAHLLFSLGCINAVIKIDETEEGKAI